MASEGRSLTVLLIEDNLEEAKLIRLMLTQSRRETLRVEHVTRLQEGLGRLQTGQVDIVLLDFSLPDSTGLASFERTREVSPNVPIVILTNLDDEDLALRAVR
jgi:DNA-binding response OmpR family regulator